MGNVFCARVPPREPLPPLESPDLHGVVRYTQDHARRIVVMVGAGVSTSAGIPDFRSPGSGLYDNLQKYSLPSPEAIFQLQFFKSNPAPFYDLVKEMWPGRHQPTLSHWFLRLLHERGLLLRVYSQNIDSLETAAGLPPEKLVAAHGNFDNCHVVGSVGKRPPPEELRAALEEGGEGWRALADRHGGLVKPTIVFFGENLPSRFFQLQDTDFAECDLLIVMGTSLRVQPFAGLINQPRVSCPRLLLNREAVGDGFKFGPQGNGRDVFQQADCDTGVLELCRQLGWEAELLELAGFNRS